MKIIDIVEEKIVGKEIDISDFIIEVEDGTGIRYAKDGEITSKYAKVQSVYDEFSGDSLCIGVNATIGSKKILFPLWEDSEIRLK